MEANELRIGNYVNTENGIKRVSTVSVDGWSFHSGSEGILLTEEWLLKFGFDKGIDKVYCIKTKIGYLKVFETIGHVLMSLDKYSNCFKLSDNTKYVHQLQNLYFALTGLELKQL
jgi:hypothetical protein